MNETNTHKMFCITITTRNNAFGYHSAQLCSAPDALRNDNGATPRLNFATYAEAHDYAEAFAKWSGYTFIDVMEKPKDDRKTYVQVDYKS